MVVVWFVDNDIDDRSTKGLGPWPTRPRKRLSRRNTRHGRHHCRPRTGGFSRHCSTNCWGRRKTTVRHRSLETPGNRVTQAGMSLLALPE